MERLTIRNSEGSVSQPMNTTVEQVFGRLAYYEDLEEQGRLIVLPCKVGDTVYMINEIPTPYHIYECRVEDVNISEFGNFVRIRDCYGRRYGHTFDFYGKTVFLTREEAEEALRKEK